MGGSIGEHIELGVSGKVQRIDNFSARGKIRTKQSFETLGKLKIRDNYLMEGKVKSRQNFKIKEMKDRNYILKLFGTYLFNPESYSMFYTNSIFCITFLLHTF